MKNLINQILQIQKSINKDEWLKENLKDKYGIDFDVNDYDRLKEINSVIDDSGIPLDHLKDSTSFKRLIISPDNSFYCKHNRVSKTITLSEQLFDGEFRKMRPFHRIKAVPTLYELLVHELGHTVEQNLGKDLTRAFQKQFGWLSAKTPEQIKKVKSLGYVSSLTSFLTVPKDKLTTIDGHERKKIADKIKLNGLYQKPNKLMKISWYGITGPREDFAEAYSNYVLNPINFRQIEPERYEFMKNNVFRGKEYIGHNIIKSIRKVAFLLKSANVNTTLFKDSTLDAPYEPIYGTEEYIRYRKELKEKVEKIKKALRR